MNIIKNHLNLSCSIFVVCCILSFTACNKSYITGGQIEDVNKYKNLSTYDVIAQLPGLDTLKQLIDAAGIKDKINTPGTTFFATQNLSISAYLAAKTFILRHTVSANATYTLDSLLYNLTNNIQGIRDSMLMYLVNTNTLPTNTSNIGTKFPTMLTGDSVIISYEYTKDPTLGSTGIITTQARVMYFTNLWGAPYGLSNDSTASMIPAAQGTRTLVQTSFINTQNGVINVLRPGSVGFSSDYSTMTVNGNLLFYWGNLNRPY